MDETEVVAAATSPDAHSKILFFLEQFWSFVTVSVGVALGGVAAKRVVAVFVPQERIIAGAEERGSKMAPAPKVEERVVPTEKTPDGAYRSPAAQVVTRVTVAEIAVDPGLPLWYRLWRATISMHPVIVGGLCGLTPIPIANWVPEHTAAHVLWFALAGALSGQIFEIGNRLKEIGIAVVRQRLGVKSEPPPPPPPTGSIAHGPALAEELEPEERSKS